MTKKNKFLELLKRLNVRFLAAIRHFGQNLSKIFGGPKKIFRKNCTNLCAKSQKVLAWSLALLLLGSNLGSILLLTNLNFTTQPTSEETPADENESKNDESSTEISSSSSEIEIYMDPYALKGYSIEMGYFPQSCIDWSEYDSIEEYAEANSLTDVTDTLEYAENTYVQSEYEEYFLCEPIVWDIIAYYDNSGELISDLSIDNVLTSSDIWDASSISKLIVTSQRILATKQFNAEGSWAWGEGVTIYDWLNNDFYDNVFTATEKSCIIAYDDSETAGETANNALPIYSDIDNTNANVWLISVTEADNWSCFPNNYGLDSLVTEYSMSEEYYNDCLWMRSNGSGENYAYQVCLDYEFYDCNLEVSEYAGIQPSISLVAESYTVSIGRLNKKDENGNEIEFWISDFSYFSTDWLAENEGTESDPYIIDSAEDLAGLAYLTYYDINHFSKCYFKQTSDIDLSGSTYNSTDGLYWFSITGFYGNYDGNDHVISYLKTNLYALFSTLRSGSIHDLGLENSSITSDSGYAGGIVGYNYSGTIYNCYNSSTISGKSNYTQAGGIAGFNGRGTIYNCYNTGSVTIESDTIDNYVGGIVGINWFGTIYNCYNLGSVTSETYEVGGIVGVNEYGTIYNCYNSGSVTSEKFGVGGIAGAISGDVTIYNCFNTGEVIGTYDVGGIAGSSYDGSLYNCYNTGSVTGSSYDVGGVVGLLSDSSAYNCYNTGAVTGTYYVGGVVGQIGTKYYLGYLYNSFNVGSVTATSTDSAYYKYVGGVVGYLYSGAVSYCYYGSGTIMGYTTTYTKQGVGGTSNTDTSGQTAKISSITTYAKDKGWFGASGGSVTSATWNSNYQWNFDSVWAIASGKNNDYPILMVFLNYTIEYNNNFSVLNLQEDSVGQNVPYCSDFETYSSSTFSCGGYTLLGWSTTSQGFVVEDTFNWLAEGSSFTGGEDVFLSCDMTYVYDYDDDVTLYAVWLANSYVATFNSNFEAIVSEATEMEQYFDVTFSTYFETLSAETFEYAGYYLIGWSTTAQEVVTVDEFEWAEEGATFTGEDGTFWACGTSYVYGLEEDATLYAVWLQWLFYDSSSDFWYFEEGYMPQSVYGSDGTTAPTGITATGDSYSIQISASASANVEIYSDSSGDMFALVTIGDEAAWFNVEPIKWVVAYGSDEPTSFSTAVTADVVMFGYVASSAGAGWNWSKSSVMSALAGIESANTFTIANSVDWAYDFMRNTSQGFVTNDGTTYNSTLAVASVSEIDGLGGSYKTVCTDFVAFLASGGTSVSGGSYVDYWTRDLAYSLDSDSYYGADSYGGSLNNGVYVTEDGTLMNAKLSNSMGCRLSISL